MDNNQLYHYGVLGMRWGVRKNRNPSSNSIFKRKKTQSKDVDNNKKEDIEKKQQAIAKKKERVLKTKSAKELYKHKDLFTDDELRSAYNRLVLETNLNNLIPKDVNAGKKFINDSVDWTTKIANLVDNGTRLYNGSAKIYNTFSPKGKANPLPIIKEKGK